jgi:hypothetical protein
MVTDKESITSNRCVSRSSRTPSSVTLYGNGQGVCYRQGFYLFIAPAVRPEIICLWKNRNIIITGRADRLEAAKR